MRSTGTSWAEIVPDHIEKFFGGDDHPRTFSNSYHVIITSLDRGLITW